MLTNELANLKHAANRYINRCLDEWELPLTVSGRSACDWSERGRGKIDSWIHLPDHRNVLVLLNTFHLRQQMRAFQTHKMSHRLNCVLVVCLHELLNAARPSLSSISFLAKRWCHRLSAGRRAPKASHRFKVVLTTDFRREYIRSTHTDWNSYDCNSQGARYTAEESVFPGTLICLSLSGICPWPQGGDVWL